MACLHVGFNPNTEYYSKVFPKGLHCNTHYVYVSLSACVLLWLFLLGEHGVARGWKHGELRFGHNHLPRDERRPRAPAGNRS